MELVFCCCCVFFFYFFFQCFAGMGREKEKINLLDVCFEGIEITCQPDKTAYESELEV